MRIRRALGWYYSSTWLQYHIMRLAVNPLDRVRVTDILLQCDLKLYIVVWRSLVVVQ
jgi:hypothetical protein